MPMIKAAITKTAINNDRFDLAGDGDSFVASGRALWAIC
jgi:hypothetical protein